MVKMIKPENKRPCMRAALLGKRDGSRTTSNSVTTTPEPYVCRVIDTSINRLAFPAAWIAKTAKHADEIPTCKWDPGRGTRAR